MPACPYHEHSDLVDAIEARDADRAAAHMVEHLQHVEASLDFQRSGDNEIEFDAVFA